MSELTEPIQRFIAENIASVAQLEVLLLLKDSSERVWTVEEVARLPDHSEHEIYFYAVRLAAFGLILAAIIDKNRPRANART